MAQPRRIDVAKRRPAEERRPEDRSPLPLELPTLSAGMEPGQNCAYNETRGCFLGIQVVTGDFTHSSLKDWMSTLTPNSGAGIWMNPFRGILAADSGVPLDLLYLDEDCRVLDAVEFYPTFSVSPSSPPAASVLALPSQSIHSSQTQKGDKLVLCSVEEMKWQLELPSKTETVAGSVSQAPSSSVPGPVLVREEPKKAAGPALVPEEPKIPVRSVHLAPAIAPGPKEPSPPKLSAEKPWLKSADKPSRSWLKRWLFPDPADPRKAGRQPVAGLVAHFFTGGAPQAHEIRDISGSGLFVVTTERWYPGTVIRMTLSKPDIGQAPSERSITIQTRAVRWGNDGVGLEFVMEAPRKSNRGQPLPMESVDSGQLNYFLKRAATAKL